MCGAHRKMGEQACLVAVPATAKRDAKDRLVLLLFLPWSSFSFAHNPLLAIVVKFGIRNL